MTETAIDQAKPGELCTCGRPAIMAYLTEKFGRVPFCGVSDLEPLPGSPDALKRGEEASFWTHCHACGSLMESSPKGRPRQYCSAACRQSMYRERHAAR